MNKYVSVFKINAQETLQYFMDFISSGGISVIYVFAFYNLWRTIYNHTEIAGFSFLAIVWYLTIAQILRRSGGHPVKEISKKIQDGTIISLLNKPINFMWLQCSGHFGKSLFPTLSALIFSGTMIFFLVGFPTTPVVVLPLLIFICIMGVIINFLMGFSISTAAFWIEDAEPLHWVYDKVIFILGGFLFPIDLLPPFFMSVARFLPTSYFIYYPAKLIVDFNKELLIETIIGQVVFIVLLVLLGQFLLNKGIKKMNINGG
jgi:ABC-2 type transport system permease protein